MINELETEACASEAQQAFNYDLAMPMINFNIFISQTKPDPRLKCLNLQGKEWLLILQKAIADYEGVNETKINVIYTRMYTESSRSSVPS